MATLAIGPPYMWPLTCSLLPAHVCLCESRMRRQTGSRTCHGVSTQATLLPPP